MKKILQFLRKRGPYAFPSLVVLIFGFIQSPRLVEQAEKDWAEIRQDFLKGLPESMLAVAANQRLVELAFAYDEKRHEKPVLLQRLRSADAANGQKIIEAIRGLPTEERAAHQAFETTLCRAKLVLKEEQLIGKKLEDYLPK